MSLTSPRRRTTTISTLLILIASLLTALVTAPTARAATGDLVITGVMDGPLSGGVPKVVEFYAVNDIPDLGIYGFGSANNGSGPGSPEFTFSGSADAGDHLWIAGETDGFTAFFGVPPTDTSNASSINGDDAIELFRDGAVVDVFGDVNVDGTGQPWDYLDGWAYRVDDTGQDGDTFAIGNWAFSGTNALDGETTNGTAATPFPIGTYAAGGDGGDGATDVAINELRISSAGDSDDISNFVELAAEAGTSLDGLSLVVLSGEFNPGQVDFVFDLDGQSVSDDGYFHLGQNGSVPPADLSADFDFFGSPSVFVLVAGDVPDSGDDLDVDDDGALDSTPWTEVVDAVAFVDGDANPDVTYDATVVAPTDDFTPAHAFRCPDATGDFNLGEFADTSMDTPGAANACNTAGGGGDVVEAFIHEVQGDGATSPLVGGEPVVVEIQAVVTSLFTANDTLDGFFVQEEDADADADDATSEGVFVFCRGFCPDELAVGDLVTVTGEVDEFFGTTQVEPVDGDDIVIDASGQPLPTATEVALPAGGSTQAEATFEAIEGMVVTFPGTLAVSEYFELARYGQLVLTADERPFQFTHQNTPSVDGYAAFLDDLETRRIILDDDNNNQNDATSGAVDEPYPFPRASWPDGGLSVDNFLRGGDTVEDLTGVMHWSFAGADNTDAWRIRPIDGMDYTFDRVNERTVEPAAVGGSLKVASFNVLNYFTSIDDGTSVCQAGCRGADSEAEFQRQQDKIVAALAAIDAGVVGLIEIENNDTAVANLVDALNAAVGAGTYAAVETGEIGTDSIKVGFIHKPATVEAIGDHAILDSTVDPTFIDSKNRPALAQTFREVDSDAVFTAAVNHLKSKGSDCADVGEDESIVDGQANCSRTRADAAVALANWLATDPTGSGDDDVMILGDLNAYRMEDAIVALDDAGYTDLNEAFGDDDAYSYVFDGQLGYLDHAMTNPALTAQVTGATQWHINADEVGEFDYNDAVQDATEAPFNRKSDALPIYAADPYRSSDHDPVIVGLELDEPEPEYPAWDRGTVYRRGDRVTYDGRVFEATWWTRGEVPGRSNYGSWQEIALVDDNGLASWTSSRIYTRGDQVNHDGKIWEAAWWTRADRPGASNYGAWMEVGEQDESGVPAWTSTFIHRRGDVVRSDGGVWEARWYSRNVEPGTGRWFSAWKQIGGVEFTLTVLHNNDGESDLLASDTDDDPGAGTISRFGWLLDDLGRRFRHTADDGPKPSPARPKTLCHNQMVQ